MRTVASASRRVPISECGKLAREAVFAGNMFCLSQTGRENEKYYVRRVVTLTASGSPRRASVKKGINPGPRPVETRSRHCSPIRHVEAGVFTELLECTDAALVADSRRAFWTRKRGLPAYLLHQKLLSAAYFMEAAVNSLTFNHDIPFFALASPSLQHLKNSLKYIYGSALPYSGPFCSSGTLRQRQMRFYAFPKSGGQKPLAVAASRRMVIINCGRSIASSPALFGAVRVQLTLKRTWLLSLLIRPVPFESTSIKFETHTPPYLLDFGSLAALHHRTYTRCRQIRSSTWSGCGQFRSSAPTSSLSPASTELLLRRALIQHLYSIRLRIQPDFINSQDNTFISYSPGCDPALDSSQTKSWLSWFNLWLNFGFGPVSSTRSPLDVGVREVEFVIAAGYSGIQNSESVQPLIDLRFWSDVRSNLMKLPKIRRPSIAQSLWLQVKNARIMPDALDLQFYTFARTHATQGPTCDPTVSTSITSLTIWLIASNQRFQVLTKTRCILAVHDALRVTVCLGFLNFSSLTKLSQILTESNAFKISKYIDIYVRLDLSGDRAARTRLRKPLWPARKSNPGANDSVRPSATHRTRSERASCGLPTPRTARPPGQAKSFNARVCSARACGQRGAVPIGKSVDLSERGALSVAAAARLAPRHSYAAARGGESGGVAVGGERGKGSAAESTQRRALTTRAKHRRRVGAHRLRVPQRACIGSMALETARRW
ncbi:hypothetical protein DFH06DRAFT_1141994 [Mycena polygramma]|nr:hypothetical protein DFH06DRAFT_1141994 [Mycena polygramma]